MTQFSDYNPVKNALDDAVRTTRARPVAPAVLNQRKTARMSIDEMNATDVDTLREKFLTARRDDRGPVESFLDLLDAPRNTIYHILAPSLEAKARAEGNTGAFGQGRVGAADVLGSMGMKPGVIRGVLGFIGDVALDPLTYVGPPGWGAKVATSGGRAARFGVGAGRALEKGVDPTVQALKAVVGDTANLKEAVLGGAKAGGNRFVRAKRFIHTTLGSDVEREGGIISKYLDMPIEATDLPEVAAVKKAASDFYAKFGAGAGPGIRFGRNEAGKLGVEVAGRGKRTIKGATSAVAHVPFTDIGVYLPAFTAPGIAASAGIETAKLVSKGPVDAATSERLNKIRAAHEDMAATIKEARANTDAIKNFYTTNGAELERIKSAPSGQSPYMGLMESAGLETPDKLLVQEQQLLNQKKMLFEKMQAHVQSIDAIKKETELGTVTNPLSVLLLRKEIKQHEAMAGLAEAQYLDLDTELRTYGFLKTEESKHINNSMETVRKLASMDEAWKKGGPLVEVARMGGEDGAEAITRVERNRRLREIENERLSLDQFDPTHQQRLEELDAEEKAIADSATLTNNTVGHTAGMGRDKVHPPLLANDPLRPGESIIHGSLDDLGQHLPGIKPLVDDYEDAYKAVVDAERRGSSTVEQVAEGTDLASLRKRAEEARNRLYEATAPLRTPKKVRVFKGWVPYDYNAPGNPAITRVERATPFPTFGGKSPWLKGIAGFFTNKPEVASRFATGISKSGVVGTFDVTLGRTHTIDAAGKEAGKIQFGKTGSEFQDAVESGNFDTVLIKNTSDEGDVYVSLKPDNIGIVNHGSSSGIPTEPLLNHGTTVSELEDAIRAADRKHLDESLQRLLDIPEYEIDAAAAERDILHNQMNASILASMATNGSAIQFLNNDQSRALQLTKLMLGTTDDLVGAASMTSPATIMRSLFKAKDAEIMDTRLRMAEAMRKHFGGSSGEIQDALRRFSYMKGDGAQRVVKTMIGDASRELRDLAKSHGVVGKESELLALINAIAYQDRSLKTLRTHDIAGNPVGFTALLKSAAESGFLNEKLHPGLGDALRKMSADWMAKFQDPLTAAEIEAGVLPKGKVRSEYAGGGHQTTRRGKEYIETKRLSTPGDADSVRKRAGVEKFLQQRVSGSADFPSSTGRKEVFEADRWTQTYTDAELEAMTNKAEAADIREKRDLLNEYDAHPNRAEYPMLENDPMRLNALIKGETDKPGRFQTLFGAGEAPGGLFDENFLTSIASRTLQHETAMAHKGFDNVRLEAGLLVPRSMFKRINEGGVGTHIPLENGAVGRVVRLGPGKGNGIAIGDDVFRAIQETVRADTQSPIVKLMGANNIGELYHTHVADAIEAAVAVHNDQKFWKWLDRATSLWKTSTLMHPAYAIGNFIGDSMNAAIRNPQYLTDAFRYGRAASHAVWDGLNQERMGALKIMVNGSEHNMQEYLDMLKGDRVFSANRYSEAPMDVSRSQTILGSRFGTATDSARASAFKADYAQLAEEAKMEGMGPKGAAANAAYMLANDRLRRWAVQPWYGITEKAQDWTRLINYLSHRNQGFDHASAVARVVESMFDYHQMTHFERTTMRRIIPFYAWLKNNGVYQAKMMMERPIYAGALPVFQRALEEALDGEERVPMNRRPQWMREALAIQLGSDPESRAALTIGSWVPQEQGVMLGKALTGGMTGAQSAAKDLVSGANPFVRTFGEIGAGRQVFSGKTIGPSTDEADISIPQEILSQIRPLHEAQKIVGAAQETGVGSAVGRALIGGRVQPFTDKRIETSIGREFADEEARIRNGLRTAKFQKDAKAELRLNVKLLKLYEAKKAAGQKIPRWAEKTLAQLTTTQ